MTENSDSSLFNQNNIKFIQAIEKYPCLYNRIENSIGPNISATVSKSWEKVSQEINQSVSICQKKWNTILVIYNQNLERPFARTQPNYYIIDTTTFLNPFYKKTRIKSESNSSNVLSSEKNEDDSIQLNNSNIQRTSRNSQSFKAKDRCQKTARKMFLLSLFPDVNSMSDYQMRLFRKGVIDLVDRVLMNKDEPESRVAQTNVANVWSPNEDEEDDASNIELIMDFEREIDES